jgi:hypothetical protein
MRCRWYVASRVFAVVLLSHAVLAQQPLKQPIAPSPSPANAKAAASDAEDVYRNTTFGFNYKIPFGWVNRTKEMSQDSSPDSNDSKKSILLLAMFEHPPEASGDSVNSAIVVAAEEVASYPGLRSAEQYFGPLTELTKSKGLTVVNEPYEFRLGEMQLVRGDFSKPLGNLTMYQSTLVVIEKGYVVSFTFIGGSEDEADQLVEGLTFSRKETPASRK